MPIFRALLFGALLLTPYPSGPSEDYPCYPITPTLTESPSQPRSVAPKLRGEGVRQEIHPPVGRRGRAQMGITPVRRRSHGRRNQRPDELGRKGDADGSQCTVDIHSVTLATAAAKSSIKRRLRVSDNTNLLQGLEAGSRNRYRLVRRKPCSR